MRGRLAAAVAAAVCGIAAGVEPGVKLVGYTSPDGDSYIEVVVTGEDDVVHTCPRTERAKLWPQYNLASVLVPGLSPLAYNKPTPDGKYDPDTSWLDPLATAENPMTNGLPDWWNDRSSSPLSGRAYRLRPTGDDNDGPVDSLLFTGLFIPEVELDGNFWWPTTKNGTTVDPGDYSNEPANVNKVRASKTDDKTTTDTVCRSYPRPSAADALESDNVFADLEVVQDVLLRNLDAAGGEDNVFERKDVDTPVAVDTVNECNLPQKPTEPQTSTLGNLTGYKYAPTGAVNFRLYKDANSAAAPFLRQLPFGSARVEDASVNPRTVPGTVTFRKRTVGNLKRYPGMAPVVAPWGPAAAAHRSPGRPFFGYAVKRCPGHDTKCCLVVEGDGDMAVDTPAPPPSPPGADPAPAPAPIHIGAEEAVTQVSVDIPSKLTTETPADGDVEYRLRWNQLSAHTSFSRVVPDTGSMNLPYPWGFRNMLSYKDPNGRMQDDLTSIWRHITNSNKRYDDPAVVLPINRYAVEAAALSTSRPSETATPRRPNHFSPKCYYQRRPGAREREVMMYLEHFYVGLNSEDEVHQLNKKKNQVPSNFTNNMKHRTEGDGNNFEPFCDPTKGYACKNTEWAPGNPAQPTYDKAQPFALETHFEPGEGNSERHIKYPTSRLPLWFGGGHSSGFDRNEPGGCNVFTGKTCNPSATDDNRGEVNGEFGPYSGNIPCYNCWKNAAHQFENVIAAMVKRYGPDVGDNKHFGCQNDAKGMGGQDYNNPFSSPGSFLNPKRYFRSNHYWRQGVCNNEQFRVVVWDVDSTFRARRVDIPAEDGAAATTRGYRVDRGADQMVHLMRLHTGAAPVGRGKTQMKFTNYRPVRSMFAKDSKPDDPSERDWSVETMCFGDHGDPGTEECANWACGSGARWCHQRSGDDIKQHLDWDAPWQQLPIRGTSDGTFRNNFWQSVCWIDPFAPGTIFGTASTPGVKTTADYSFDGSGKQKSYQKADGIDKNGVFHPVTTPDDAAITATHPGLYFRTYTAGSLFPGNSMDIVAPNTHPFYDRGGMTSDRDRTSWDRSAYTVRSPGQEHPIRWYEQYQEDKGEFSEYRMWWGGAGGNTMCMAPGTRNEMIAETQAHTRMFRGEQDLEICQTPVEGMASHTCADQNNRTFFGTSDFGSRRISRHTNGDGESWDMRYMFSKSPLRSPFQSGGVWYFDRDDDQANLRQDWRYSGPIGANRGPSGKYKTDNTFFLPQGMPKIPAFETEDGWNVPLGSNAGYNTECNNRKYIDARAELYMPFHRADDSVFPTFDGSQSPDATEQNFWGEPYWATGAGGAMGCSSPANPPWAFPGLVLNERTDCPATYTAQMSDDCKFAAWAPNVIERWDYDASDDTAQSRTPTGQNYWKPQPIFKYAQTDNGKDETGVYRGPPWPEWSFEMLHGWQSQTHMGRVNWGSHYISGEKFVNLKQKTNDGIDWTERYTEGPYPSYGKNDGLLECPSSMLERNFHWHQNIMQYSLFKKADICLGDADVVDESGLDSSGVAAIRDRWSWCVNPSNLVTDLCSETASGVCGEDGSPSCRTKVEGYCKVILSDSRTLAGDEQEYEESAGGDGGRVTEDTARNFCKCNGQGSTVMDGSAPEAMLEPGARPENIRGDCLCRSLARTSRVVVGPSSLFRDAEKDFERPAFLNYTDVGDHAFPFCRCGGADPCLIRRVCKRGLLGNPDNPLGALNAPLVAGGADGIQPDGTHPGVDGALRFDRVPVRYVTRSVPYAGWEMERLNHCASSGGTRNRLCESESVTVFPVAGGVVKTTDDAAFAIGVRFEGLVLDEILGGLGADKPLTHEAVCVPPSAAEPAAQALANEFRNDNADFKSLWGSYAGAVTIQLSGDFCVFTVPATTPLAADDGPILNAGGLLRIGDAVVGNPGALEKTAAMDATAYGDADTFSRKRMEVIADCMMFSLAAIRGNQALADNYRGRCFSQVQTKRVRLRVPAALGARVAKAVGRCESPGISSALEQTAEAQQPTDGGGVPAADGMTVFEFTDLCPDFVGIFTAGPDETRQQAEICTDPTSGRPLLAVESLADVDGGRACQASSFKMGKGVCVNRPVALDMAGMLPAAGEGGGFAFTAIGPFVPVQPTEEPTPPPRTLDPVVQIELEVACANMDAETDIQYFLRNTKPAGNIGVVYSSVRNRVGGSISQTLEPNQAVAFGAVDFSGGGELAANTMTIQADDAGDFELVACTRTSRDISRLGGDADASFTAEIVFGVCSDTMTIDYTSWPTDGPIRLDVAGHRANPETNGTVFQLDDSEHPRRVTAYVEAAEAGGLREYETVPAPCRDQDQAADPFTRRLAAGRIKTTYGFRPGRCPDLDTARFCDAGGGAWAIRGGLVGSGTRGAAPGDVAVEAAGLDWRTVPAKSIAECHALCVTVAAGGTAGGGDAGGDAGGVCALLHWKAPEENEYGRCSVLLGEPYHPRVVRAPVSPSVTAFSGLLASESSGESIAAVDYLVLCPSQADVVPTGSPPVDPPAPADPECPEGFRVQPGDNTGVAPICVLSQCPSDMFADPSQEVRPMGARGPHCGPKEERLSQMYPAVERPDVRGLPSLRTSVTVEAVAGGDPETATAIGPLDMHFVDQPNGETIRVVYDGVSVDLSHLAALSPRASLKALRVVLPNVVFVPRASCACTTTKVNLLETTTTTTTTAPGGGATTTTAPDGAPALDAPPPEIVKERMRVKCAVRADAPTTAPPVGPRQDNEVRHASAGNALRVYARATVTLGDTVLANRRTFEFEPLANLEDAARLFAGLKAVTADDGTVGYEFDVQGTGTVNEGGFGRGSADGMFASRNDLAHAIYLDLRDGGAVALGKDDVVALTVSVENICAVGRDYDNSGIFPEPDGTDEFWSSPECTAYDAVLVPGRDTMAASAGDASVYSANAGVCDKPNNIDAHLGLFAAIATPAPHELEADFEWCRPVDLLPHGCTTLTLCSPETHYEAVPPTATSDRGCVAITSCNADTHYESAAPTPTTDRACTERTRCDLDVTFYRTGGTDTSDTVCVYRGACATGTEFHANTAAATSDTECVEITQCADDGTEYESASHTVATDRECTTVGEDCPVGTAFKSAEASATTDRVCTPVSVCVAGEAEGTAPTADADRVCVPVGEPAPPPDAKAERTLPEWSVWTISGAAAAALAVAVVVFGD